MHETWVNGASEFAELSDQTNVALGDWFVGIGADDAAGYGTEETNARSKGVD